MVSTHSYDGVVFNFESAKFGFKLNTDLFVISGQINPSQPVDQVTEFKFESNFKPLPVIRQSLHKPGPKAIPTDNLDCKINGLALRAALRHSLGKVDQLEVHSTNTGHFKVSSSRSDRLA